MPSSGLANLLEIGGGALPLNHFLSAVSQACRRLRIRPAREFAEVSLHLPGADSVVLPPDVSFPLLNATSYAQLERFVGGCRPARLLALHEAALHPLAQRLAAFFRPDLILWPVEAAVPAGFLAEHEVPGAEALGLARHRLLSRPGFHALRNALLVQADAARRARLRAPCVVHGLQDVELAEGFWPLERDGAAVWAWTGPQRMATLLLSAPPPGRLRLTLYFYAAKLPVSPACLAVEVDGHPSISRHYQEDLKIETELSSTGLAPCLVLRLLQQKLAFTEDRSRQIGVALHKIKCEVLT